MARFKVVQVIRDNNPFFDWVPERLEEAGIDFQVHISWNRDDLARYAADADLVWSYGGGQAPDLLKGENLNELKKCGAILRTGSGTDNVDLKKATELGIIVANTPQAVTEPVSDHTLGLLFSLVRQVTRQDRLVRSGEWNPRLAWPGCSLTGATLGLVGFGHVPRRLVQKLAGLRMNFLVYDPYVSAEAIQRRAAKAVSLDELLQTSDFVSLHCPLTTETRHLIGERELKLMRKDALLINTARGSVVDEPALIRALEEGWIAGAALDVLEREPPDHDNPLLQFDNVILTPHIAGYDISFPHAFLEASVEAIIDLAERRWPYSVVNPGVKPRWGALLPGNRLQEGGEPY